MTEQQQKTKSATRAAEWMNEPMKEAQLPARIDVAPYESPAEAEDATVRLLRTLEARNVLIDRLRQYAMQATTEDDWVKLGDRPWMKSTAAESVARRCAISMRNCVWSKVKDDEGEFTLVYEADFTLAGSPVDVLERSIGTCSSQDRFLVSDAQDDLFGSLLKAARSNCIHNGVTALLGIRGLTWETIAAIRGKALDQSKVSTVEYRHGAKGGGRGGEWTAPFGDSKGKSAAELTDKDLKYFLGRLKGDLADESKAKYHATAKTGVAAIEAELARRAAPASDTKAAPAAPAQAPAATAGNAAPTPKQRVWAMGLDMKVGSTDLMAAVKRATGKAELKDLVFEDVEKVRMELQALPREPGQDDDIPS